MLERAPVAKPTRPLIQFTDKRTGSFFVVDEDTASRYRHEYWAIDETPWSPETGVPLSDDTLRGTARFLLGPVERDGIYCSPWCGFKCTKAAYDRAVREADQLCKLLGPGWEPEVWENTGWNFAAHKGGAKVTPNKRGSTLAGTYTIESYTGWCNFGEKQTIERGETPGEAIAAARAAMEQVVANLQAKLEEAFG